MNISDKNDSLNVLEVPIIPHPPLLEEEIGSGSIGATKKFSWLHLPMLMSKIFFKFFRSQLKHIWMGIAAPLFKFMAKTSEETLQNVRAKKENKEVAIDHYIKEIESRLDFVEAQNKIKEIEISSLTQEYESKVRRFFDEGVCRVQVTADGVDYKQASKSMSFGIDLYQYMAGKLKESALGTNIDYMTVTSKLDNEQITHVVEFELKTSGQSWSTIFSKFIGKEIFHKIEWAGGVVDGHHRHNATLIRDTFVLAFSHQRIELIEVIQETHGKNHNTQMNQDM